jgi:simple sugar transport system permease protein
MLDNLITIVQTTLMYATPLILAGIGGLYSERSGVVNIALEGLMTIGAFTAAVFTIFTGNAWLGLLAAIVAGILLALPHAVASVSFKADQVVSGVAINFLALGLSVYLVKHLYQGEAQTPVVPDKLDEIAVPVLSKIPVIGPALFKAFPVTYLAIAIVIVTAILLYRTPFGMRLRAVG